MPKPIPPATEGETPRSAYIRGGAAAVAEQQGTGDGSKDEYFRARLLADYDRLIREYEEAISRDCLTFAVFLTPMDGKLVLAALRTARNDAALKGGKVDHG